jgi:hypothetical protein
MSDFPHPAAVADVATVPSGRRGRWRGAAILLWMGLALAGGCDSGASPPQRRAAEPVANSVPAEPSHASAGSVVHLDPAGRPVAPAPAIAPDVPRAALRRAARPPQVEPAPGGGEMVILDTRFARDLGARRAADGRVELRCERARGDEANDRQ